MAFLKCDLRLLKDEVIKGNAFRVHSYLLSMYNKRLKYAYPSMETISKALNLSLSTVKRVIKRLASIGYLTIGKRKGRAGNYNVYTNLKYNLNEERNEVEVTPEEELLEKEIVGADVVVKAPAKTEKVNKIDNHNNVRLARSVTNIDKSKFAKTVLSLAKEELVREAIKNFKKKKGKNATFLIDLLIDEYHKAGIKFSTGMFNLLRSGLKGAFVAQPLL